MTDDLLCVGGDVHLERWTHFDRADPTRPKDKERWSIGCTLSRPRVYGCFPRDVLYSGSREIRWEVIAQWVMDSETARPNHSNQRLSSDPAGTGRVLAHMLFISLQYWSSISGRALILSSELAV